MEILNSRWVRGLGGIVLANAIIAIAHVVQGLILGNWSGLHPIHRLTQFPVFVGVSLVLGMLVIAIFRVIHLELIERKSAYFKVGLVLGTTGISSVIHPWMPSNPYTDWLTILLAFVSGLALAYRFSRLGGR